MTQHIDRIGDNLEQIFRPTSETNRPTQIVSDEIAKSRLEQAIASSYPLSNIERASSFASD
ncbi:MAG: hypothetical protein CMQ19_11115 [Gammaproteobacteria bacterium]|nr:hypothetical protein [Gammaproteobacteria bacterium]